MMKTELSKREMIYRHNFLSGEICDLVSYTQKLVPSPDCKDTTHKKIRTQLHQM